MYSVDKRCPQRHLVFLHAPALFPSGAVPEVSWAPGIGGEVGNRPRVGAPTPEQLEGPTPPAHTLHAPGLKPGRGWLPCRPSDLEETEPGTPLGILKTRICEESFGFCLRRGGGKEKRNRQSFQAGLAGSEDVAEPEEGSGGKTQEKAFVCHAIRPVTRGTARPVPCPRRGGRLSPVVWTGRSSRHVGVTCPSLSCLLADLLTRGTEKEATRRSWVLILYLFSCTLVSWGELWSPWQMRV